jgi:hypothetical protein
MVSSADMDCNICFITLYAQCDLHRNLLRSEIFCALMRPLAFCIYRGESSLIKIAQRVNDSRCTYFSGSARISEKNSSDVSSGVQIPD